MFRSVTLRPQLLVESAVDRIDPNQTNTATRHKIKNAVSIRRTIITSHSNNGIKKKIQNKNQIYIETTHLDKSKRARTIPRVIPGQKKTYSKPLISSEKREVERRLKETARWRCRKRIFSAFQKEKGLMMFYILYHMFYHTIIFSPSHLHFISTIIILTNKPSNMLNRFR